MGKKTKIHLFAFYRKASGRTRKKTGSQLLQIKKVVSKPWRKPEENFLWFFDRKFIRIPLSQRPCHHPLPFIISSFFSGFHDSFFCVNSFTVTFSAVTYLHVNDLSLSLTRSSLRPSKDFIPSREKC